jgi:predicted AAA+ superfamily ATPase
MRRAQFDILLSRLQEPRKFMQILAGPRQVGKTTLINQVLEEIAFPYLSISTDGVDYTNKTWIAEQWAAARLMAKQNANQDFVLCIDEIQNIRDWSKYIKAEYDYDTAHNLPIKVVLSGSSRVMIMRGLSESLAGRFEIIHMPHWSYPEMQEAFGMTVEQYIFFGGYPGAAHLIGDVRRWRQYIKSSIIEATMERDVLIDTPINNPPLLRKTLELATAYSGQELAVQKIVGELQDFGSNSTAKNYLTLLGESGLVGALEKYSVDIARRKSSVPKMQVYDNALRSYYTKLSYIEAISRAELWGHLYESSVGTHLINATLDDEIELFYWRERDLEVDYVLRKGRDVIAIEVKSNKVAGTTGLNAFRSRFNPKKSFVVGSQGIPLDVFLSMPVESLFD